MYGAKQQYIFIDLALMYYKHTIIMFLNLRFS